MAEIIKLTTHSDPRGHLTVCEKALPFEVKRFYMIYGVGADQVRGAHRHIRIWQAALCTAGSCRINVVYKGKEQSFLLDNPSQCLILKPEDWHTMQDFSKDCSLLVLASDYYDKNDYVTTPVPP